MTNQHVDAATFKAIQDTIVFSLGKIIYAENEVITNLQWKIDELKELHANKDAEILSLKELRSWNSEVIEDLKKALEQSDSDHWHGVVGKVSHELRIANQTIELRQKTIHELVQKVADLEQKLAAKNKTAKKSTK